MTLNLDYSEIQRSIAYAENNFLNDNADHLKVDKAFIEKYFDLDGKKILDFGSGMGGMSLWYATNWDCTVHGVDIDGHHVAIANHLKDKHKVDNVHFEKRDILSNPLTEEYDFIFMNDVAEHIPYPVLEEIFKQFHKLLKAQGRIFISYPPWESPYASHVTRVTKLPWCQFLPQPLLLKWIEMKNEKITGEHESDLLEAYNGLNRLTHTKLMEIVRPKGFRIAKRVSHSILKKVPILRGMSMNLYPLQFLVSKEMIVFVKESSLENGIDMGEKIKNEA